jgi:hypothetical protein
MDQKELLDLIAKKRAKNRKEIKRVEREENEQELMKFHKPRKGFEMVDGFYDFDDAPISAYFDKVS